MNNKSEDRGMMKWAPFYSVLSEKEIGDGVEKHDINEKPELSEDQINEIENIIMDAYNNKLEITILVYDKHKNYYLTGYITKLDPLNKTIYINKKPLLFTNILKITY